MKRNNDGGEWGVKENSWQVSNKIENEENEREMEK